MCCANNVAAVFEISSGIRSIHHELEAAVVIDYKNGHMKQAKQQ